MLRRLSPLFFVLVFVVSISVAYVSAPSGSLLSPQLANAQQLDFNFDATRVSDIIVNGRSILGPNVGTNGIYLVGSSDGSDNNRRGVISVGGSNGYMVSDDPAIVPSPPFALNFRRVGDGRLDFRARVGPVPANFSTISMPFDFGKQFADSFSFNGNQYRLHCTDQDGPHSGSGTTYNSFQPVCQIPNTNGAVAGGAYTDRPTTWGEVSSSIATVRVNVLRHSHYRGMSFFNHTGTNNMEFSFGSMRKGESAFIEGEIIVTPKSATSLTFQSEANFLHQVGRSDEDGWSVRVGDSPNQFMSYGPYTRSVQGGNRTATFRLMLDNVTADNYQILSIDVYDASDGRILAQRGITRMEFNRPFTYQYFSLNFNAIPGHLLEFRTYWHGGSYVRQDNVTIQ